MTFTLPERVQLSLQVLRTSWLPPWLSLRYRNLSVSLLLGVNPAAVSMDLALAGLYGYGS